MKVTVETKEECVTVGFGDVIQLEAHSGIQHYLITYNPSLGSQELLLVDLESGFILSDGIELTSGELRNLLDRKFPIYKVKKIVDELGDYNPIVVTAEVTIK